jgi:hypothetical protein
VTAVQGAELSDDELVHAIVVAVNASAFDVAKALSDELADRKRARLPGNLVMAAERFQR